MVLSKVVIWGYPLHSHTHSYIHASWVKTFKHLGYETYWFDDDNVPTDFDFTNCLFITEGYADKKIPIHNSSVYIVHVGANLDKYIAEGALAIDMRYNNYCHHDSNYNYNLVEKIDKGDVEKVGVMTYYEPRNSVDPIPKMYTAWATDLLPHEFNENDIYIEPENKMVFIGSISDGNNREYARLSEGCRALGIQVIHRDPWKNPVSFEENRSLIQSSIIVPDIRGSGDPNKERRGDNGTNHKAIGYVPCRVFKNISYGKLGATNSKRVKEIFGDDLIIYDDDEYKLAQKAYENRNNFDLIKRQMEFVKKNHTYVNRIDDILAILAKFEIALEVKK